jgi:hypothetical protein
MATDTELVQQLVKINNELAKKVAQLEERMAGLEKAHVQLNETYNKHIAGLHVQRI